MVPASKSVLVTQRLLPLQQVEAQRRNLTGDARYLYDERLADLNMRFERGVGSSSPPGI